MDVPIVFLTAHTDRTTMKLARATDPFGYITKPFDEQQLCISIEIAICKHQMEKEKEVLIRELQHSLEEKKRYAASCRYVPTAKKSGTTRDTGNSSMSISGAIPGSSSLTASVPAA